ncbi:MAG: saccharopine dehydrogenase family protein, partial [Opitutales bacterium]
KPRKVFIYNVCDHQECYAEVKSQAISYTTGVPAAIGGAMLADGKWLKPGVWNMEEMNPDPFMEELNKRGLPWHVKELPVA